MKNEYMTQRVPANSLTAVIWMTATRTTTIMTWGLEQIICDNNGGKRGQGGEEKQKQRKWEICGHDYTFSIKTNINPPLNLLTGFGLTFVSSINNVFQ